MQSFIVEKYNANKKTGLADVQSPVLISERTEKEGFQRVTSRMDASPAPGTLAYLRRCGEVDMGRQTV